MNTISSLLVLGGARSGKSAFAQAEVEASGLDRVFVATAEIRDGEMQARVACHREARDSSWRTIEAPFDLPGVLMRESRPDCVLLVDCLTLWLSNLLLRGDDLAASGADLVACLSRLRGPVVFVSNEVGTGIVPDNALARAFRDEQGHLNRAVAQACDMVVLVAAGLPVQIKPAPRPAVRFRSGSLQNLPK